MVKGGERAPHQHRDDQGEDDHLLERARPERRERLEHSEDDRAEHRERVARHAAEDRADESLQPDQEARVVVDRRGGRDQDARDRADERREREAQAPESSVGIPTRRAPTRLIAVARSALP